MRGGPPFPQAVGFFRPFQKGQGPFWGYKPEFEAGFSLDFGRGQCQVWRHGASNFTFGVRCGGRVVHAAKPLTTRALCGTLPSHPAKILERKTRESPRVIFRASKRPPQC
eukprot:FR740090.1.p1 GENE.FR740090.1~~FR740090.1.p1  ORF type:complete len:110 (-),score=12.14 FR740090.1:280-609(-)